MCPPRKGAFPMPYYENDVKAAFSIVLLLTKIQKGFIKFLEPADCGMFCPNSIAVVRYGALIRAKSPTNCDAHLAESLFQTRSSMFSIKIPYPLAASWTKTWVTAPITFPFCRMGLPDMPWTMPPVVLRSR